MSKKDMPSLEHEEAEPMPIAEETKEVPHKGHGWRERKKTPRRDFKIRPAVRMDLPKDSKRLLMVMTSSFLMAFSMRFFMDGAQLLPGGFNGLTILIQRISDAFFHVSLPFSAVNLLLSFLPALYAFFNVGRKFVILSVINIVITSILMDQFPMHLFTDDILLNVGFGAFIHAVGLAVALNAGASTGGTDFIAMSVSNRYNISVWNYVMAFNATLLIISGMLFDVEKALYSIVFQFLTTQILNRLHRRYQKKTVFLITEDPEPISTDLMKLTHHGITSFEGVGRYSGKKKTLLYMVVSKEDLPKMKNYLRTVEPKVFMNVAESQQLTGEFYLEPIE